MSSWARMSALREESRTSAWRNVILWWGCAFVFWLNANPYIGIDHDSRLYILMAYRWLNPAAFARDPWFAFGSQDDFSLFSPLLAGWLSIFGVDNGAIAATLLQGACFALACVALVRAGLGRDEYPLAVLLMVSFPILYSPNGMLFLTEGFVTARGFAVPLSLAGLACNVRGRAWWAAVFHVGAFLLHPIMAIAPAAVAVLISAKPRLRPWVLLAGWVAYVLLLLAALHGRLPLIEGEWRAFLEPAPLIFIDNWIRQEASFVAFWGMLLWLASCHGHSSLRALYRWTFLVVVSGVGFSMLATVVPWTLALQAQCWRGLWLMKLLALCALADLLWQFVFCATSAFRRTMSLGAAMVLLLGFYKPVFAAIALLVIFHLPKRSAVEAWLKQHRLIFCAVMVFLLVSALPFISFQLTARVHDIHIQGFEQEVLHGVWRNSGFGLLACGLWWLGRHLSLRSFVSMLVALVAATGLSWDIRTAGEKTQESRYAVDGHNSLFAAWIPRGATVSWHDATVRVWLELATAGYAGVPHATGLVFSEQRTKLLAERFSRVALATLAHSPSAGISADAMRGEALGLIARRPFVSGRILSSYESAGLPSAAGIGWLCQDPALDFVIDPVSRPDSLAGMPDSGGKMLYLYRCEGIRAAGRFATSG